VANSKEEEEKKKRLVNKKQCVHTSYAVHPKASSSACTHTTIAANSILEWNMR